jgi:alkylation response protein AidB-like acyl-CoA dehydrogenase
MALAFTEEQREFRAVLRRFFAETSPPSAVRRAMETELGFDPALWGRMAAELGLLGLHVPEAYGGAGFGFVELGIVLEEMGRALVCAPYFSSVVLASTAIVNAGTDDDRRRLLPALVGGQSLATLAFTEPSGSWEPETTTTVATPSNGGGFRLKGEKGFVLDGCAADMMIVLARAPGSAGAEGLSLFVVQADARGVERTSLQTLDPTRKLARVRFDDAEGVLLGEPGGALGPLRRTLAQAAAALANEMVGGAERLREDALAYAKLRVQFGRPLAAFQAMKHKQADMLLDVELAKSAAYRAAADANGDDAALFVTAALAKAVVSDAYMQTALHAVQIHGGIGFTWENNTHLWFRRAKSSEVFLGEPNLHRERMLCAMGD